MFHIVSDDTSLDPDMAVTPAQFRDFLTSMTSAGFNPISFYELENYVTGMADLPENPFVVTFDDGYLCNFEIAFPILQELKMPAVINVIGGRRGANTYQGNPSIEHFTWSDALIMLQSGLIEIGNHTYAMHGSPGVTRGRVGFVPMYGEAIEDFKSAVIYDIELFAWEYYALQGNLPRIFAYPFGWRDEIAESLLVDNGYTITLLTGDAVSLVSRYDHASLHGLYRINVSSNLTSDDLIWLVRHLSQQALID